MPTNVKVIRTKNKKRVRIGLSFAFNADDPQAAKIYQGIALLLREALTDDEQRELLDKFEAERAKLAAV
jgi:hypothetical protein